MTGSDKKLVPQYFNEKHGIYGFQLDNTILAGMPYPKGPAIWPILKELEISQLVCLTSHQPDYQQELLDLLDCCPLQDLYGGRIPRDAQHEKEKIRSLVQKIRKAIKQGRSTVIHCIGGTGRTGTVIASTLINLGYTKSDVLQAMEDVNRLRGRYPQGWPESDWQREVI